MKAQEITNDQDLAAYHLAQAEAHERAAAKERMTAIRHLAAAQSKFKQAFEIAKIKAKSSVPQPNHSNVTKDSKIIQIERL